MGFVYQVPAVVGGTVLIIERIESQNYVTGVSGWAIHADGTAEFFNVVVRGSLITGVAPNQRIEINGTAYPGEIAFFSGDTDEVTPGRIMPNLSGNTARVIYRSPEFVAGIHAELSLESIQGGATVFAGEADNVRLTGGSFVQLLSDLVKMGDSTNRGDLVVESPAPAFHAIIRNEDEIWNNFAFAGTWANFAGFTTRYFKDATGSVHVTGAIQGGAAVAIGTLPVGYRPTQTFETLQRGGNPGPVMCAIQVSTAGAVTLITNLASATVRCAFDFTFPTF